MNFDYLVQQKELVLSSKNLCDDDLDVLAQVLQKSSVLRTLYLSDNQISLVNENFTNALAKNRTLQTLSFDSNKVGPEGARYLANALKVNQSLGTLYLSHNQIGSEGTKHLAGAMVLNKSLQSLSLHTNRIGDDGAKSLATSVPANKSLRVLFLSCNNIGNDGAQKIAAAIERNLNLTQIFLTNNDISSHVKSRIESLLDDPKRQAQLKQMGVEVFNPNKDEVIGIKDKDLSRKDEASDLKDKQIADLLSKQKELENMITSKTSEIESLEARLERSLVDRVDLTSDESEWGDKNPRRGNAKSSLAIQHQNIQKIVQIKQEKSDIEATLKTVQGEKHITESALEEVREDLGDANELVNQQCLATNIWQGRFDELASLVESGKADGAAIAAIRGRSLADGR